MNKNKQYIGVYRGAFDPPHNGHLSTIICSFKDLNLSHLLVSVKFLGKKDLNVSSKLRIKMLERQIADYKLPVQVVRQHPAGFAAEVAEIRRTSSLPILNICGLDKASEEMMSYAKVCDAFGIVKRHGYLEAETLAHKTAEKLQTTHFTIQPEVCAASENFRTQIQSGIANCADIHPSVLELINRYKLYENKDSPQLRNKFFKEYSNFMSILSKFIPEIKEYSKNIPVFSPSQRQEAWNEKYIRTVLSDNSLIEAVRFKLLSIVNNFVR